MEFRIEKTALLKLLGRAVPAAAAKSPMALLTHLKLSAAANGNVTFIGTDLVLSVSASASTEVKTPGAVAVGARSFHDVVKSLPAGDLTLSLRDGKQLELKAGKSRFKVPHLPADEFPAIPRPLDASPRLRIKSGDLARMLSQTVYARCADDDSRQFIACVRIEQAGGVAKCVATDSKRLGMSMATCERESDWGADHINARALADVRKLCEEFRDVEVAVSAHGGLEGYLFFEWPGVTLTSKSAGSNFVPYQKFIPESYSKCASVDRQHLVEALKRASLAAGADKAGVVRCELKEGALAVSARSAERGESSDELEADYTGEDFTFGVAAPYLIEALNSIVDDTVLLKANGPRDPLIVVGEATEAECLALVMFSDL